MSALSGGSGFGSGGGGFGSGSGGELPTAPTAPGATGFSTSNTKRRVFQSNLYKAAAQVVLEALHRERDDVESFVGQQYDKNAVEQATRNTLYDFQSPFLERKPHRLVHSSVLRNGKTVYSRVHAYLRSKSAASERSGNTYLDYMCLALLHDTSAGGRPFCLTAAWPEYGAWLQREEDDFSEHFVRHTVAALRSAKPIENWAALQQNELLAELCGRAQEEHAAECVQQSRRHVVRLCDSLNASGLPPVARVQAALPPKVAHDYELLLDQCEASRKQEDGQGRGAQDLDDGGGGGCGADIVCETSIDSDELLRDGATKNASYWSRSKCARCVKLLQIYCNMLSMSSEAEADQYCAQEMRGSNLKRIKNH